MTLLVEALNERRAVTRNHVLRAGTIQFGGDSINCMVRNVSNAGAGDSINCMLRNMSVAGAMLYVTSSAGIPERFTMIMSPDGYHVPCHVVWRQEKRIGVAFE